MSAAQRIAFVCPRFAEGATVGGAETLLGNLARRCAAAGREVTFLTTCARNHFTWANERPAGTVEQDGMTVRFFPVDAERDEGAFLRVQELISRGAPVTPEQEQLWLRNSVNSAALIEHLSTDGARYDRLVAGPYLFGLVYHAAAVHPEKTLLVPCLHDEPFAYLHCFAGMFGSVAGCMFNSPPERDLAQRLYGNAIQRSWIVGMGLDPFEADARAFASTRGIDRPYVMYAGRREPLKGTPLLIGYMTAFRKRTGRDVLLVLAGSGPVDVPAFMQKHVLDAGFLSEPDKHSAMAGALTFAHPSVNESLGIVLLESWLAGAPGLVHGKSAVLRYQCEQSNGGLWFRNYPEFEEELIFLLETPKAAAALGRNGRRYVETEYSWPSVEQRLFAALDAELP